MAEGGCRDGNADDFESEPRSSDDSSDSDDSDISMNQKQKNQPCKFYNARSCRSGSRCKYLHVCQYYFNGHCKYGTNCRYKHDNSATSTTSHSNTDDGNNKPQDTNYQWQIYGNNTWLNIEHDWLIEAQYSQPGVIGIQIYNTIFGAISIDFKKMEVRKKDLKVRRRSGKDDHWLWYCRCDSHWNAYGHKDSQGNCSDIDSTVLEKQYQMNRRTPYKFIVNNNEYLIDFTEMKQTNVKTKTGRQVRRRPQFMGIKADSASGAVENSDLCRKPVWQFWGDDGCWHNFKQRGKPDSVINDQLEQSYQLTPQGSMGYCIGKFQYELDFSAMCQTNITTGKVRKVQRV